MSREISGSENNREPGESPARGISGSPGIEKPGSDVYVIVREKPGSDVYVYSPGEARLGSLCTSPGVARYIRIVLACPAEADSDVYVIVWGKPAEVIPGVTRRGHIMDEIPVGNLFSLIIIMLI